jgi:hypothetical protein
MAGSFATSDQHPSFHLKPLAVSSLKSGVFQEAKDLAGDLPGWRVVEADDERLRLTCERAGGALSGTAVVTITCDGPDGIPSTIVNVKSETAGGLLSRDKKNVLEFMRLFHRRVC